MDSIIVEGNADEKGSGSVVFQLQFDDNVTEDDVSGVYTGEIRDGSASVYLRWKVTVGDPKADELAAADLRAAQIKADEEAELKAIEEAEAKEKAEKEAAAAKAKAEKEAAEKKAKEEAEAKLKEYNNLMEVAKLDVKKIISKSRQKLNEDMQIKREEAQKKNRC